ncbi:hypothetical protein [Lentzea sp.]|uniref:hypothetical protein n=1 Tax=Lentzea sp. TaxID=56099 RepID=UPI002ED5A76D
MTPVVDEVVWASEARDFTTWLLANAEALSEAEEHRAALEWLNERTDERTRFFGVRIEVVRIGTSPPAPLFTLVVQPNDWGKKVRASAGTRGAKWTEDDFFSALMDTDARLAEAARALFDHSRIAATNGWMYWGEGARPSMTAQIPAGSQTLQPWSFYLTGGPNGGPGWAINFEWIHKGGRGADESVVEQFAGRLAELPGLAGQVEAARAAGWRRRPTIPARTLTAEPNALKVVTKALEELYRTVQERHDV